MEKAQEIRSYKRILIFNVNWLGDVLFSTATIRNIRKNFQGSFIACVIPSRCYPILKGNPHLDEIIIFDEKDRHRGLFSKLKFIRLLRGRKFDAVFLLHRSFTRALICRLAGIGERIGYATKKRSFLLTKKIEEPKRDSLHRIDYYLNILKNCGFKTGDRSLEFYIEDKDRDFVDKFLGRNGIKEGDFLVAVNPGGNWRPKRWATENWASLAEDLITQLKARVIITGAQKDIPLATEIKARMASNPIIACGVFNVKQLAALAARVDVFVTADTGPLHIANTVSEKKVIALFGPTSPEITGPYPLENVSILQKDTGCKIPCYAADCKENRCMKAITPTEVLAEIKRLTFSK